VRLYRLGSADSKNSKIVCVSPIHRLCAADVGQNEGIVSAVADIRGITTVSANQPRVEACELHRLTAVTMKHHRLKGNGCLAVELIADAEV
jgi:hypothetical protein